MNKYTFMGNGTNKDFYFTFSFFTKADIVVKINNETASGYGVFCIPGTANNDFPFTGGHIHFANAPKPTDSVTIERVLQLNRLIDYQPTVALNPTTVNQDMNYFFELLKDIKSELNDFADTYSEFTETETAQNLLNRIDAVTEDIDDVVEKIEDLGDITTIRTNITNLGTSVSNLSESLNTLSTTVGTHTTSIGTLGAFKEEVLDYVIESQSPSAQNNYTWYRKYKSGWVEQGGLVSDASGDGSVTLPVTMADTNYQVSAINEATTAENAWGWVYVRKDSKTTTGFGLNSRYGSGTDLQLRARWMVCGVAAQ